jgi:hypothetical protein
MNQSSVSAQICSVFTPLTVHVDPSTGDLWPHEDLVNLEYPGLVQAPAPMAIPSNDFFLINEERILLHHFRRCSSMQGDSSSCTDSGRATNRKVCSLNDTVPYFEPSCLKIIN